MMQINVSTRFDQKVLGPIWFGEKHTAMLVCLCEALLRKEGAIHLQKSKRLSSISVRKELHEYFMQTLGKEYIYSTEK